MIFGEGIVIGFAQLVRSTPGILPGSDYSLEISERPNGTGQTVTITLPNAGRDRLQAQVNAGRLTAVRVTILTMAAFGARVPALRAREIMTLSGAAHAAVDEADTDTATSTTAATSSAPASPDAKRRNRGNDDDAANGGSGSQGALA